ncbi:DUF302 domain-containing protein [Burkholderia sp. 3C]
MSEHGFATRTSFEGVRISWNTHASHKHVMENIRSACGRATIPDLAQLASRAATADDFAQAVEAKHVGTSGFMIFAEIDHASWLRVYGYRRALTRVILGNPLIAITMMQHDMSAGLFAPVELLVSECADGAAQITYVQPSTLIAIDDQPLLKQAAQALDEKLADLVSIALINHG